MRRRQFLEAATAAGLSSRGAFAAGTTIALVQNQEDSLAASPPARWALRHLEEVLARKGATVKRYDRADAVAGADLVIVAGTRGLPGPTAPATAVEALALAPVATGKQQVIVGAGHDTRGLVYALLELADRVEHAASPSDALRLAKPVAEQPANRIRSVTRLFVSDQEDKSWFNDREMWPAYLTMLAANRFNRFNLSFGIGYDFLRQVTDAYFLFLYPFLIDVPGYYVRAKGLADSERDRNLDILRFIAAQTVARGMEFQLGIWTHGYKWENSPSPNYTIEGITPENHAVYCRDAVAILLKEVPEITGVTFRVHGESGVEEGSYDFWKTVFDGVVKSGREVEIDMHAKGMDDTMLSLATATGMPVKVSPKFWAEHMGMPYHQADIRQQEVPRADRQASGLMKFSAGSRSFLRYGYGDLLREDRKWGILHRIWPGTQRVLLWGDPVTAAAYSRAFSFCGSDGVEIMEPLSFKGRRGSGFAGNRTAYAEAALRPRWDWQKYEYTYRVWGRRLYNPDCDAEGSQRYLSAHFGAKAASAETALANASRILPTITTAHGASAANNTYWPEVYTNQPIVNPDRPHPYRDTPVPRTFGNVSPFDPQLFSRVNEFAEGVVKGARTGKYSPLEVAQWLEEYAGIATKALAALGKGNTPEQRRFLEDVSIQVGLGQFFAAKLRAAVLYAIHEHTGDRDALLKAVDFYKSARSTWTSIATRAKSVYISDITVGERPELRGHWLDRLPAIDGDIADMQRKVEGVRDNITGRQAVAAVLAVPDRTSVACRHTSPERFQAGQPFGVELSVGTPVSVRLYYRHVNQAERWESVDMKDRDNRHQATIPVTYTDTVHPLAYYFELRDSPKNAWLYPGFNADRTNQPYFVVRRA